MELNGIDDKLLFGDDAEVAVPPTLVASAPVVDMSFHPHMPLLALGLVTGEVEVFNIVGNEAIKKPLQSDFANWVFGRQKMYSESEVVLNYHNQNMRLHPTGGVSALEFTDDGNYLVSASSDRTVSVVDCATSRLLIHLGSDDTGRRALSKRRARAAAAATHANAPSSQPDARTSTDEPACEANEDARMQPDVVTRRTQGADTPSLPTPAPVSSARPSKSSSSARKLSRRTGLNPHRYGISALNICDENLVATGDDDGLIVVWDMRARRPAHCYHEHGDYVTQLCYFTDAAELVSSSGDTCLGVFDVRAGRVRDYSEPRKDELSCFAFVNSSGVGSANFLPTIMCGTPAGVLPMWKYGSWRRPYDVLESHPRECEALISFHADERAFNHNLILTGAADGLVRVIQMYPIRRNLCQLSARDYSYAHANSASLGGGEYHEHQSSYAVKRERGDAAILRMRVSHDGSVLAVSGSDAMVDFVDVRFLNDCAALDALRGKAERRHMSVIRNMEHEANEKERRERIRAEEESDSDEQEGVASSSCSSSSSVLLHNDKKGGRGVRSSLDAPAKTTTSDTALSASLPARRRAAEISGKGVSTKRVKTDALDTTNTPTSSKKVKKSAVSDVGKDAAKKASTDAMDSMEAYELSRAQKREQAAAARWLKDEKKKKINFTFEKRRRRVGGFFGDMFNASRDDDN